MKANYARYALTESGVSPRAVPGGEALVIADSDEHTEQGHLTEDLNVHLAQQDKRMRKLDGMAAEAIEPELHGPDSADTLLEMLDEPERRELHLKAARQLEGISQASSCLSIAVISASVRR